MMMRVLWGRLTSAQCTLAPLEDGSLAVASLVPALLRRNILVAPRDSEAMMGRGPSCVSLSARNILSIFALWSEGVKKSVKGET